MLFHSLSRIFRQCNPRPGVRPRHIFSTSRAFRNPATLDNHPDYCGYQPLPFPHIYKKQLRISGECQGGILTSYESGVSVARIVLCSVVDYFLPCKILSHLIRQIKVVRTRNGSARGHNGVNEHEYAWKSRFPEGRRTIRGYFCEFRTCFTTIRTCLHWLSRWCFAARALNLTFCGRASRRSFASSFGFYRKQQLQGF